MRQTRPGIEMAPRGIRLVKAAVVLTWLAFSLPAAVISGQVLEAPETDGYRQSVLDDRPVAYWTFDETATEGLMSGTETVGDIPDGRGPEFPDYPLFPRDNPAKFFGAGGSYLRVPDPGPDSILDFHQGDTITIEAWVQCHSLSNDRQVYIVGKGRTQLPGTSPENQNYALRLRGVDGTARISFLFRAAGTEGLPSDEGYHRWNSNRGFPVGRRWHHVAVSYTFGEPESIQGYLNGEPVDGTWDLAGASDAAPVVDDDELWFGTALGANAGCTLEGAIDEVALYRHRVPPAHLARRFAFVDPAVARTRRLLQTMEPGTIHAELLTGVGPSAQAIEGADVELTFTLPVMVIPRAPTCYDGQGLRADRSNPFLLRASMVREWPAGRYRFLLRARNRAVLSVDGRRVASTPELNPNASGHEAVPDLPVADDSLPPIEPGSRELVVEVELESGRHLLDLELQVGGKGLRPETGEVVLAWSRDNEPFRVLGATTREDVVFDPSVWPSLRRDALARLRQLDDRRRRERADTLSAYWQERHRIARDYVRRQPPIPVTGELDDPSAANAIDRFLNARMEEAGTSPASLVDDRAFARRVYLDVVGVVPTSEELAFFLDDPRPDRRARLIDRLLEDPRWADHWVGYWQDMLAENPGILKPEQNNTGPFRWWIYESFLDNKPIDRLVTELVMMRGSRYYGGPAGFGMATQNDSPMAAKAHVVAQGFLAIEMKCARCHDAPFHEVTQRQLFELAAALEREPIALPVSSTVPIEAGGRVPAVTISLSPGDVIDPAWPFESMLPTRGDALWPDLVRDADDPRERVAARLTSPCNPRFAQVMANRLWRRYLGRGLVEPIDDWYQATPTHPELLEYLGRYLVEHDYDLKMLARLILNSHAYQREAGEESGPPLFSRPARRRMTAEQVLDSLFVVAGKGFQSEQLTLDPEGRRPVTTFLNLGRPSRAWHMTSLSNERDRPALSLPAAQGLIDVLLAFGWRDARPHPQCVREDETTALQPLILGHGVVGSRVTRLSDDHALTPVCLEAESVEKLVEAAFLRILGRPPTSQEMARMAAYLEPGFENRRTGIPLDPVMEAPRHAVSWSNHLHAEATRIKLELERIVRAGDPPTRSLDEAWRMRMEDVIWALVNSPEFVVIP